MIAVIRRGRRPPCPALPPWSLCPVWAAVRLVVPVLRVVSGCGTHRLVLSRASLVGGRSVDVMIAHKSSSRADPVSVYPMGV